MKKQTSICYVIPYFGKLPAGFKMWLLSCSANDTIDWILYTDDYTEYDYPNNVKVHYCSYEDIKNKIQKSTCFRSSRYKYQANVNTGRAGIYQHGCKSA